MISKQEAIRLAEEKKILEEEHLAILKEHERAQAEI